MRLWDSRSCGASSTPSSTRPWAKGTEIRSAPQLKRDPLGRTVPYNTSFAFDSVVVIESLPGGEIRSGRELFDTVLAPASTANPGLVTSLYEAGSGREVLAVLEQVKRDAE